MQNQNQPQSGVVEEALKALGLFANEKGIIIDLQLPGNAQTPVELWTGIKTKADTRKETKNRKRWKQQTQGKGKLLLTGRVNALSLVDRIISEIKRPVEMIRLREVIDFRYQARIKVKFYFLSATWRPRNNDESDDAAIKVDVQQLWQRRPSVLSRILDQIYKVQIFDNPDSLVVRLVPRE